MPKLTIRSGSQAGTEFEFEKPVVLGRGPLVDLSLDDNTVSRQHAVLHCSSYESMLLDLNSENGSFVNQKRIFEPTRLKNGDILNPSTRCG